MAPLIVTLRRPRGGRRAILRLANKLPLPTATTNQLNPLTRDKVQDGGRLTLPLSQLPTNFNLNELDGTLLDNVYVMFAMITVLAPIPALGVTADVIRLQGFDSSGAWVSEPQRALALGVLYFAAVGLSELFNHAWVPMPRETVVSVKGSAA